MTAKEAAQTARAYLRDTLGDEQLSNLGVEEVEYEPTAREWRITIGFSRPWDYPKTPDPKTVMEGLERATGLYPPREREFDRKPEREYKVVLVDDAAGTPRAIRNRAMAEAVSV